MFIPIVELASQLFDESVFVAEVVEVGVDHGSDDSSLLESLVVLLQCGGSVIGRRLWHIG